MKDFKKQTQQIIEYYCEGINHLEFDIDKFPEMLNRIEIEALRIHDVIGSFTMQELMVFYTLKNNGFDFNSKAIDVLNSMVNKR